MTQLTKEQALAFAEAKLWEDMTLYERAEFQINQELLCMPFSVFHEAIEAALGRPVWTHEFGYYDNIKKEFYGERPKPTFEEIIGLIPEEKRIIIQL